MKMRFLGVIASLAGIFIVAFSSSAFSEEWGVEKGGLKTRLVPLQSTYALGQPMKFKLEMTNVSSAAITYSVLGDVWLNDGLFYRISIPAYPGAFLEFEDSLVVNDPAGTKTPFVSNIVFQTMGGSASIQPGETVVLNPAFDLNLLYKIDKPGKYTVQFSGRSGLSLTEKQGIPASNTVSIEVAAGTMPKTDSAIDRLMQMLPENWKICVYAKDQDVSPAGRKQGKGARIGLSGGSSSLSDIGYINLWLTEQPVEKSAAAGGPVDMFAWEENMGSFGVMDEVKNGAVSEYLGESPFGHVYILLTGKSKLNWPDFQNELVRTLDIHNNK
ncbi:MAG: hypothetical protein PHP10_04005 [Candidatus Omnitrophica bacterium]|nr:hypothetical protein [Candidatus Omnitrophota bacterium]